MSRRPSPSRSPVVTPFQRPTILSSPQSAVASRKRPWSLRNSRSDPHSGATMRSGQPSPFTSEKTAAETIPTSWSKRVLTSSNTKRPPSFRNSRDETGSGYAPGATRPPTNSSRPPSPPTSAAAPRRDQQVLLAVAVDVVPRHPRSELAQRLGEERLTSPVVVRRLYMAVAE